MATVSESSTVEETERLSSNAKVDHLSLEPDISSLPSDIQDQFHELEEQLKEDDLTEKGYYKRRNALLLPYLLPYPVDTPSKDVEEFIEPELDLLPKHIVEQLNVLQVELDNEEITEKGYGKRRSKLLQPFMLKEPDRHQLPVQIQKQYNDLEDELHEGDITEKGFKKKILKLLKPFLVAVYPSLYLNSHKKKGSLSSPAPADMFKVDTRVVGIQSVLESGKKVFKCEVCGEVFKQAQSFSGHCRLHRGERSKNFQCSICNCSYTTRSHLKFHMYKHTGNFPYTCWYCDKGFAGKSQHKYHEMRHTGESPYTCDKCGARIWKKENLEIHREKSCTSRSSSNKELLEQRNDETTVLTVYACDAEENCQETFGKQEELASHIVSVHGLESITMAQISLGDVAATDDQRRSSYNARRGRGSCDCGE